MRGSTVAVAHEGHIGMVSEKELYGDRESIEILRVWFGNVRLVF